MTERRPLFSSPRERRLWAWTLTLVVAIYATLGLASTLVGLVPHEVTVAGFLTGMALVGTTVLTQGLTTRPRGAAIAAALGIAAVAFMLFLRLSIAERSHLIEYGVVAVFVLAALRERKRQGRRVPLHGLIAIAVTTLIGAVDEGIQLFVPSRVFDPEDILFNFLAALMAVSTCGALRWLRNLGRASTPNP